MLTYTLATALSIGSTTPWIVQSVTEVRSVSEHSGRFVLNSSSSSTPQGALNLHQEEQVEDFLLRVPLAAISSERRVLVVFHCEFSSERGPRMCRFVRKRDRSLNEYPRLHYPELYILKGGYKDFFPHHQVGPAAAAVSHC